jgi:hypothetical protein
MNDRPTHTGRGKIAGGINYSYKTDLLKNLYWLLLNTGRKFYLASALIACHKT